MELNEAIESLKKSLERGDSISKSKNWSGGNFKSEAVRVVLAALSTPPTAQTEAERNK